MEFVLVFFFIERISFSQSFHDPGLRTQACNYQTRIVKEVLQNTVPALPSQDKFEELPDAIAV